MFLRVHSLLHLATDLNQAELCVKSINATFTALIATGAFSSMRLNQVCIIYTRTSVCAKGQTDDVISTILQSYV